MFTAMETAMLSGQLADEAASPPTAASATSPVCCAPSVELSSELAAPGGKREREDEIDANANERQEEGGGSLGEESVRTSDQPTMKEEAGVDDSGAISAKRQKTGNSCRSSTCASFCHPFLLPPQAFAIPSC